MNITKTFADWISGLVIFVSILSGAAIIISFYNITHTLATMAGIVVMFGGSILGVGVLYLLYRHLGISFSRRHEKVQ